MTRKERAERYIDAMPEAVSGSGGHAATFKVACVLWNGFHLDHEDVVDLLRHYNRRCDPPWTEKELQHKAREAARVSHDRFRGHLLVNEKDLRPRSTRRLAPAGAGEVLGTFEPLPDREGDNGDSPIVDTEPVLQAAQKHLDESSRSLALPDLLLPEGGHGTRQQPDGSWLFWGRPEEGRREP